MNTRLSVVQREKLAEQIRSDIDAFCVSKYEEASRAHLGASEIGEPCARRLVYSFRWMHKQQFNASMLRLFNRGHLEENRFVEWLNGIGCIAKAYDEDGNQFRIKSDNRSGAHYGGSLDGIVYLPRHYGNEDTFLLEMKTHNAKSFAKLQKLGVRASKPKHFAQMCAYGENQGYSYGIYIAINKNDDNIHVEIVEIDKQYGRQLADKAAAIVHATQLPGKIAGSSAFLECKFCPMVGICHNNQKVDINCRSCSMSEPRENKQWFCRRWNAVIPPDAVSQACPQWSEFK